MKPLPSPFGGITFGQRLLLSGCKEEVILQALAEGHLTSSDLRSELDGRSLVGTWINQMIRFQRSLGDFVLPTETPLVSWPVRDGISDLPSPSQRKQWQDFLLFEHTVIQMVRAGLNPLQPLCLIEEDEDEESTPAKDNLLELASLKDRPWILMECLQSLNEKQRQEAVLERTERYSQDKGHPGYRLFLPRVHAALRRPTALAAEVWKNAGASLDERLGNGEGAIFCVGSRPCLEWALAQGFRLDEKNPDGASPMQTWSLHAGFFVDADEWKSMQSRALAWFKEFMPGENTPASEILARAIDNERLLEVRGALELANGSQVVLSNGRTPLAHAAVKALGLSSRSRRINLSKIVAHLWGRTDFEAASKNPWGCLSNLEVAALVTAELDGCAQQRMRQAERRLAQESPALPAPKRVIEWVGSEIGSTHAQVQLLVSVAKRLANQDPGPETIEQTLDILSLMRSKEDLNSNYFHNICRPIYCVLKNGFVYARDGGEISEDTRAAYFRATVSLLNWATQREAITMENLDLGDFLTTSRSLMASSDLGGLDGDDLGALIAGWAHLQSIPSNESLLEELQQHLMEREHPSEKSRVAACISAQLQEMCLSAALDTHSRSSTARPRL